jgi:type II secretory pathway component PulF
MNKSAHISTQERLYLISNLGTLIAAGIPIIETIDSLLSEAKGQTKKVLQLLREDLNQGRTIAESFAKSPNAFDPVTVNLIKAAEEAGTLETTLKDISMSIAKDIEFSGKVKSALAYPVLVMVVLVAVIVLNLFFVIPRVGRVFGNLNIVLPWPTKVLIAVSNFTTGNTLLVVASLVALVALVIAVYRIKKSLFLGVFFSLPLISNLAKEIDITRFTRSMSLLLASGLPIVEALNLAKDVVNKQEIKKAIIESKREVTSGRNLSDGLKASGKIIPGFMIRVIEAGEKSGTLEKSMAELSEQFDLRVSTRLKTMTALIEPMLLLVVGLMVGALMLAIIAPIYNLIGKISPR